MSAVSFRIVVGVGIAAAASAVTLAAEEGFSGARAMRHLEALCELGPRPSGSAAMTKQRELLAAHFRAAGAVVEGQAFQVRDRRTGDPVHMENLVVTWHPDRRERVLLGVHYDTRPWPDRDPVDPRGRFVGANDGASGTALLMELARFMPGLAGADGVDFVLFDAEEYVFGTGDPYFLGSTFFARQYAAAQAGGRARHRYAGAVVLDMVADRDLEIWQERNSLGWPESRPLVEEIWGVAERLGERRFVSRPRHAVEDDHVPLRMIGRIPACDVIDFDYPQWHTTADTPAHCAAESLEAVGRVILEWLRTRRAP
jgi:glutaminyl-peptide cyclotransferase